MGSRVLYTLVAGLASLALAAPAAARPNVVLIVTDDQRWDTLADMPAVQSELIGRGVNFENGFVTNPKCCPSRASILTGAYSHTTRVYQNGGVLGGFAAFADDSTLATWLHDAGYETALIGKYLNGYRGGSYIPPGWDRWVALTDMGYYTYGFNVDGADFPFAEQTAYSTDFLAGEAASFIGSADGPFFLYFAPFAPHGPATPAERHATAFADLPPWRPPSYNEPDISDKPTWLQRYPSLSAERDAGLDALRANQFRSLLAVDEAVASIIEAVAAKGQLGETLFVFMSDNGLLWGEHRWAGRKKVAYDESIRVPFIVRYDALGIVPRVETRPVLGIDVAPTIAAAAGIASPGAEGRSVLPLLSGDESVPWRTAFLVEGMRSDPPTYCMLRTGRYSFVTYKTGERELYDLIIDPYQLDNLASIPGQGRTIARLRARLARLCNPPPPRLSRRLLCTHEGTPGADSLRGARGYDILCGRQGDDRIAAGGGRDYIYAGAGRDVVSAGRGDDHVLAVDGERDRIACRAGIDTVVADRKDRVAADCESVSRR